MQQPVRLLREEVITQAAAAPSRYLRARSGEEEKSLERKWSPPQKSVKEVFVKSLEGKQNRVAIASQSLCGPLCACVSKSNTAVLR